MANYDFGNILSPLDFEHLVRDILSRDLDIKLTSFSEGKDKGIDLRYSSCKKNEIIVQCKRVKTISKAQIDEEFEKIKQLNPKKYYFVISTDISVAKSDYIQKVFAEYMKNGDFIYTKSRLNSLLETHQDIHQQTYKLWLNSSSIFNTLINKPLFERAKSLINDLKKDYKYYVKNDSFIKAIEIVKENQFIVISGIPGIGKTTLAKLLLWEYLQKGYEIIEIRKVIEGEQFLVEESKNKQVFYFDDFLGENFLKYDAIEGRSNDLVQFIKRIMSSKHKVLIMTTREYILKQAKEKYEKLDANELDIYKYTLDLTSYGKRIKALILYNHLYYSNIEISYIEALIKGKVYKKIISHKNYSPRIIEQMTIRLKNTSVEDYATSFINNLDNPFGIWDKAFKNQISEGSKYTLFVLLSIGDTILLSEFKKAILRFHEINTRANNIDFRPIDIKNYLRELEDSFIKINITNKGNHFIDFQNPSIKDFMLEIVKDDKDLIRMLLESTVYFNQLTYVLNFLEELTENNNSINDLIYSIIYNQFDNIQPSSWILSGDEFLFNKKPISKLNELKPFLKKSKDTKTIDFLLEKFRIIDVASLYAHEEKQYISFLKDFKKRLNINIKSVIQKVFSNIFWFENVRNFIALEEIDSNEFNKFATEEKEQINTKITSAIKKDIEYASNVNTLDNLSNKLKTDKETLSKRFSVDISYFDEEIKGRISTIDIEKESKNGKDDEIEIDINMTEFEEEDFNEDEYFRIELFKT